VPVLTRVTPTRRLAHQLRAQYDERCLASGLEAWATPDIVTWDELIERMFLLDRAAGRLGGRWLSDRAAQLLWERIVREDADVGPLVSVGGLARAAQQSWRRAHEWRLPLESADSGESAETEAFARWCRRYVALLQEHGWVDAATAPTLVHPAAADPGVELTGFDRLTPLQESLVARWSSEGLEVRRHRAPPSAAVPRRVSCRDRIAEFDAAARWAAAQLDGRDDLRLAIVVPDLVRHRDEVRRCVERVLVPLTGTTAGPAAESQAFELAAARPLAEQPVVAAALEVLDAFVHAPDLGLLDRLLRNPFLFDAGAETPARARLGARLRRAGIPGIGLGGLERLAAAQGCTSLAGVLADAREVMSRWPEKSLPSTCSEKILELLSSMGWPGTAPDSNEHQTVRRWRSLVSELGGCDEFAGRVSRAEAVGLLREMAGSVRFEPQELRAPLLVIDPETCAGMGFDALWVCGLDASRWPPPAAPDPFLPRSLQRQHGIPRATAELAAAEARMVLDRLIGSADAVVLSVAEMDDDTPLLPSPLLDGVTPGEAVGWWPTPRLAQIQHERRPLLETLEEPGMPALLAHELGRGGARLLELQSACPFRAQAELRLGARALDEPALGVGAAERGELVHAVLAALWREWGSNATLTTLDERGLREVVASTVAATLADARASADEVLQHLLRLEAQWLEARVLEIVAADRARPPFVVESVEQAHTLHLGELTLELRPDRVDRLADGSLAVIDYKTGANADVKTWLGERPTLPQLPAYVQALGPARVGAVAFARLRAGETGYAGLAREAALFPGLKVPGTRGAPRGCDSWDGLLADWQRRLEVLSREYAGGDARLAADPARSCEYCHLRALCRIAESDAANGDEDSDDD
jgi:probable DNA repair protein